MGDIEYSVPGRLCFAGRRTAGGAAVVTNSKRRRHVIGSLFSHIEHPLVYQNVSDTLLLHSIDCKFDVSCTRTSAFNVIE
jgi:hypothetical protein